MRRGPEAVFRRYLESYAGTDDSGFHAGGLGFRLRSFGGELLPVAAFFQAGAHSADLGFFLDDEWRAAFGTGLGDRHVRRGEIAVGIARTAVKDARASSAAASGAAAANKLALVALGAFDAQGDGARVLALGVGGAADKFAEAAVLFYETAAAIGAFFVEGFVGLAGDAGAFDEAAGGLAIRIAGAGQECAETAALDGHFAAAVFAIFGFAFGVGGVFAKFGRKVLDKIAIGITGTAEEKAVAADAFEQFSLAALLAFLSGGNAGFVGKHLLGSFVEVHDEFFPEFLDGFAPVELAFFDVVEFFLETGSEGDVEDVLEAFDQEHADAFAEHGGGEAALLFFHVFALDDGGNDGSVGGRAANAIFFQFLDESGFGVTRRRLGEVLFGANLV